MTIDIPVELQPYVRMSAKQGLVARSNMPPELMPLFEKARQSVLDAQAAQKRRLEELLK